jgi:NhaP-type Na+/H+ or K+/H+ antiporter
MDIVIIVIVGIPLGVLAGFLAARFIVMLRAVAPITEEVP